MTAQRDRKKIGTSQGGFKSTPSPLSVMKAVVVGAMMAAAAVAAGARPSGGVAVPSQSLRFGGDGAVLEPVLLELWRATEPGAGPAQMAAAEAREEQELAQDAQDAQDRPAQQQQDKGDAEAELKQDVEAAAQREADREAELEQEGDKETRTLEQLEAEQIAQQETAKGVKNHTRVSDSWGIPVAFPEGAGDGRVFSKPACTVCKDTVTAVAGAVRDRGLSKYDAVVEAQAECWRGSDSRLLGVECGSFAQVQAWLQHMQLVRGGGAETDALEAVDLQLALEDPQPFCERVNLCGKPHTDVLGPNAAVVRMRLRRDVRHHGHFPQFVRAFLGEIANALGISRSRLELHMQRRDPLYPEVAIRPPRPSDRPVHNPEAEAVVRARGLSPLALARNFRDMMAASHSRLTGPHRTTALIDVAFPVEVYQLRI